MKSLCIDCHECEGDGCIIVELNDTHIPYEQKEVYYTCMSCNGKGYELCKELVDERISNIDDMIDGMQVRMRLYSDMVMKCKKGLLHELSEKYVYKLDICSMALGRLLNYKRNLYNLVS